MKYYLSQLLILLLLAGCSDKNSADNDTELPVVTISSPVAGQVFTNGQQINIAGTITDNKYIAEVHIHVSNTNTGMLIMDVHLYPGSNSTTFNQPLTAVTGVNYRIQVIAKDRAVNEGRSTVDVSCN
ncbi:MAG: hypothetical protein JNK27_00490 [Chitinophagaceae bacterium]|nr:hypothetical protein [Chitinophagaceae bacterium]